METIEVRYAWIEGLPGPVFHKYIIYTDYQSNQFIAEIKPTTRNPANPLLALALAENPYSIIAGAPTEFGLIKPTVSRYSSADYPDFPKNGIDTNFSELIGTGANLSSQWAIIQETVRSFGQSYYRPISQNSNYVADEAIIWAGFPQPTLDGLSGHLTIGSQHQSIFDFIISPAYGGDNGGGLSNTFNLEQQIAQSFTQGLLDQLAYNDFTQGFSDWLVSNTSIPGFDPNYNFGLSFDPIGAFYESQTPTTDNAPSIALKTPVILDAANHGLTQTDLGNLDSNHDGKLNGTELGNLRAWADANENGVADANEITVLNSLGISEIRSTDYGFYTRGNSRLTDAIAVALQKTSDISLPALDLPLIQALPVKVDATEIVPASNYQTLWDANPYFFTGYNYFWWLNNKVRISNDQKYQLGSNVDDAFDSNYNFLNSMDPQMIQDFPAGAIKSNLIENFLGGDGNDLVGGSISNDKIWGGIGNDSLLGYAGNDKLYGEEGDDEILGQDGQDYLDGGEV